MRVLNSSEMFAVSGGTLEMDEEFWDGGESSGGSGDMQVVTITATQADVQAARDEYAAGNNLGNAIGAIVGGAAGMVVLAGCEAATAGVGTPGCIYVAGVAGTYVASTVSDGAKATFTSNPR